MTYNHEEKKVRDPSAAREVERLRKELDALQAESLQAETVAHMEAMKAYKSGCEAGISMARERLTCHGFHDALIALEFTRQDH